MLGPRCIFWWSRQFWVRGHWVWGKKVRFWYIAFYKGTVWHFHLIFEHKVNESVLKLLLGWAFMIFTPNSFWGKKHRFWYNFLTACISKGVCSRAFIFLHSIVNDWAISFLPKKVEKNLRKYFFEIFKNQKFSKKNFRTIFFFNIFSERQNLAYAK